MGCSGLSPTQPPRQVRRGDEARPRGEARRGEASGAHLIVSQPKRLERGVVLGAHRLEPCHLGGLRAGVAGGVRELSPAVVRWPIPLGLSGARAA